jgi:hypothetical protein
MKKELKDNLKIIILIILTMIILYILHIYIGSYFGVESERHDDYVSPQVQFQVDSNNKILTVDSVYPQDKDFYWNDIQIVSGSATLPYDTITVGDQITNCEGNLELIYALSGITIFEGGFS